MDKRLKQAKKPETSGAVQMHIGQPAVNVRVPEIKIPEIKVPDSVVNVDTKAFADAIESLAIAVNQLGQQQAAILREMAESRNLIAQLAQNAPNVQVAAPKVTIPPRPRSFTVDVDDGSGGTTQMRIRADSPN